MSNPPLEQGRGRRACRREGHQRSLKIQELEITGYEKNTIGRRIGKGGFGDGGKVCGGYIWMILTLWSCTYRQTDGRTDGLTALVVDRIDFQREHSGCR